MSNEPISTNDESADAPSGTASEVSTVFWWHRVFKTFRFVLKLAFGLLLFSVLLTSLLYISPVQNFISDFAEDYFSEALGFPVSIGEIYVKPDGHIEVKSLRIADSTQQDMISAQSAKVQLDFWELLNGGDLTILHASLEGAAFRMRADKNTRVLNIVDFTASIMKLLPKSDSTKKTNPKPFLVKKIDLKNCLYSYEDPSLDSLAPGLFDYGHFTIDSLSGRVSNLFLMRDTVSLKAEKLSAYSPATNFRINELSTDFLFCNRSMQFKRLILSAGESTVRDSVVFKYKSPADFSNFINAVHITARLDNTVISSKDIAMFAEDLRPYREKVSVTGLVEGTVSNLITNNLRIAFGGNDISLGRVAVKGLPDIKTTALNLNLRRAKITPQDFREYLSESEYELFERLGIIELTGKFKGSPEDFAVNGQFSTSLGEFGAEMELDLNEKYYKGFLDVQNFDLKAFTKVPSLGLVDIKGNIEGQGFTKDEADLKLDVLISKIGLMNYDYRNIDANGRLSKGVFEGSLSINDPNLVYSSDKSIRLDLKEESFRLNGKLSKAKLHKLGLTKEVTEIRTQLNVDFEGLDIDSLNGTIELDSTYLVYGEKGLDIDFFELESQIDYTDNFRNVFMRSDLMDFQGKGHFRFRDIFSDAGVLWEELSLRFNYRQDNIKDFYEEQKQRFISASEKPPKKIPGYDFDYEFMLKDISPVIDLFSDSDVRIGNNSRFKGYVERSDTLGFKIQGVFDTLAYEENIALNTGFEFHAQREHDTLKTVSTFSLNSEKQLFGENFSTEDIDFEFDWRAPNVHFLMEAERGNSEDYLSLIGNLTFTDSLLHLVLSQPNFRFMGDLWQTRDEVRMTLKGKDITFIKPLEARSGEQHITLEGALSENPDEIFHVDIDSLHLGFLSNSLGMPFNASAKLDAHLSDVYDTLHMDGELLVRDIEIDTFEIGSLKAHSKWDNEQKNVTVNGELFDDKEARVLWLLGNYWPKRKEDALDLRCNFINSDLKLINPFVVGNLSDLGGKIRGALEIKGDLAAPRIGGKLFVKGGRFRVDYLNTLYSFSDQILFEEDFIGVRDFKLIDSRGNSALLNGGLYHTGFDYLTIQADADIEDFMVLNKSRSSEELFYGTAVATGRVRVGGSPKDITIRVNAQSEYGTRFFLPLDSYEGVEEKSFIRYMPSDSLLKADSLALIAKAAPTVEKDPFKLTLDLDLEITPDAYAEIIFDRAAGDIIRGSGQGKMDIDINTEGKFTMFGDIELLEGGYNFTFLNVVNKEFGVRPGSHITWSGDPFGAQLDITATYTQTASLAPIVNVSDSAALNSSALTRRYPVEVALDLKGGLLSPEIGFGINFLEYPSTVNAGSSTISLESHVSSFKNRILNDEQELNRQVFSLIVLKKLSAENTFEGINAGGSVSELLTNQLSYWVSQVDENLEIDIDLDGLSPDALSALQLRLSYSFMDGRVRVTREGGFTNPQNEANLASIAGDWTLEYLITPDGKLRVKAYNRNNVSNFNAAIQGNTTTGVSVIKFFSFDKFKELFGKNKKKAPPPPKPDNEIIPGNDRTKEGAD